MVENRLPLPLRPEHTRRLGSCSADLISGRRSSNEDGKPAGTPQFLLLRQGSAACNRCGVVSEEKIDLVLGVLNQALLRQG